MTYSVSDTELVHFEAPKSLMMMTFTAHEPGSAFSWAQRMRDIVVLLILKSSSASKARVVGWMGG